MLREKIELIEPPSNLKDIHFKFPPTEKPPRVLLEVKNLGHEFKDNIIFKSVSFTLERNQKIAVVAANGVGKTTLFNLISGNLDIQNGAILKSENVKTAIFAQDQNKSLDLSRTVLENVEAVASTHGEQVIRKFLGSFLFDKESVNKKAKVLSGGEKNRVGIIKVLLQNANLLLLDEPTNHLDIPSKQILLNALQNYDNSMLFVSHDKDFINDLATHIIELTKSGAYFYHGNYDSYISQKEAVEPENGSKVNSSTQSKDQADLKSLNKQIGQLERNISQVESKIHKLQEQFLILDYGTSSFSENQKKIDVLQNQLKLLEQEWETLLKQKHSS